MDARRRQGVVLGIVAVGIVLALKSANVQTAVTRHRQRTCDGTLVLPLSGYLYCGIGLAIGVAGLVLLIRWFRGSREPIVMILAITAVSGVLFELFTIFAALSEGRPVVPMCEG
jgi:ABC-type Fe3+-siderophore transport system permease subunit